MIANTYLVYWNRSLYEYNDSYDRFTGKNPIHTGYLRCLKKLSQTIKLLNLKLVIE